MEDRKTTAELFQEMRDRLMIDTEENEIVCPKCGGLRLVFELKNDKGYTVSCNNCYNGKLYKCKHCGKLSKTSQCNCKEAQLERSEVLRISHYKTEMQRFGKAEKVHYNDYDGFFMLSDGVPVVEKEEFEEWIYDQLYEDEEFSIEFVWAVEPHKSFDLEIYDIIMDKTEDGYEDIYDSLDTKSQLLKDTQDILNKWMDEQGESLNVYYEDYSRAIIVTDLVNEIREQMKANEIK